MRTTRRSRSTTQKAAASLSACIFPRYRPLLKVSLSGHPYIATCRPDFRVARGISRRARMQPTLRMKQITVALAAAGFGLAVGAGYNRLDTPAVALANAASPTAITAPALAPTAAARLPD